MSQNNKDSKICLKNFTGGQLFCKFYNIHVAGIINLRRKIIVHFFVISDTFLSRVHNSSFINFIFRVARNLFRTRKVYSRL